MRTDFYPVSSNISDYVSGILILEAKLEKEMESLMTVKGTASLAIPFGKPFRYRLIDQSIVKNKFKSDFFEESALFGQITSFGTVASQGELKLAFVVFTPVGLYSFLQQDVSRFTNMITPISDIPKISLEEDFFINLKKAKNDFERVKLIEDQLQNHFANIPKVYKRSTLDNVLNEIIAHEGNVSMENLAEKMGKTKRSLELNFKKKIGLTPKIYSRIVRFNALYNRLLQGSEKDFFEMILQYSYVDQSHFIRDFVEFTGFTPKKYLVSPSWLDLKINQLLSE
jgi:AraC-like DNA-binding protein